MWGFSGGCRLASAVCAVEWRAGTWPVGLVENGGFRHHIAGIPVSQRYFLGNWDGMCERRDSDTGWWWFLIIWCVCVCGFIAICFMFTLLVFACNSAVVVVIGHSSINQVVISSSFV